MAGIIIELTVDDKGTVKIKQFTDDAKKAFEQMKKGPEEARGPLASLQEGWVALTAKIAVASGVIYGIHRALSSFVAEAADFEASESRLGFAVERAGYSWGVWKTNVDAWNESIVKTTLFTDTQANQALARMLMYTTNIADAQKGARLAMDLSTRSGEGLEETLRMVGMAMTGNVEILGRYFPQFRNLNNVIGENASLDEKAAYAMKVLTDQFGGMGKQLPIFKDQVTEFNKSWGDTKKLFGEELLGPITTVLNVFKSFFEELRDLKKEISEGYGLLHEKPTPQKGITAIFPVDEGLPDKIKTTVLDPYAKYKKIVEEVNAALASMEQLENEKGQVFLAQRELVEGAYVKEKDLVDQVRDELIRLERETNEVGEITVAKQDLIESGWKKAADAVSETRRVLTEYAKTFGDTALEQKLRLEELALETGKLKGLGVPQEAIDKYTQAVEYSTSQTGKFFDDTVNGIVNSWTSAFSTMRRSQQSFSDWFKGMWLDVADSVIAQIVRIMAQQALMGSFKTVGGAWSGGGGLIGLVGSIFSQEGFSGWVDKPTAFLTGEGGERELVNITPESKMGGKIPVEGGGGGGDTYVINNYNQVNDPTTFVRLYGPVVKKLSEQAIAEAKRFNKVGLR